MKDTGMWNFARAVMWVLREVFACSDSLNDKKWMLCETSEKYGRILLAEVIKAGNFVKTDERIIRLSDESSLHRFGRIAL